jgi:putative radical SAM enzyme (TIGR03279 family)
VICPGLNDGDQLHKTITDLAELAPGVDSMAIVPVGLTRYRKRLPDLRTYTPDESAGVIDLIESYHQKYLDQLGTRFVFPSDEWFIVAGRKIPALRYYEEMPQFENGVGMSRQFIVDFNRRKRYLPQSLPRRLQLEIVTGRLAEPMMRDEIMPVLSQIKNLHPVLSPIDNKFWGQTVTVTGLLTGRDILDAVSGIDSDMVILPPNCLNSDALFLDDLSLEEFYNKAGRPVIRGSYNLVESLKTAFRQWGQ